MHRLTDADNAALTLMMRDRANPGNVLDQLATRNLLSLHADDEQAREHVTARAQDGEALTVATNDEAAAQDATACRAMLTADEPPRTG